MKNDIVNELQEYWHWIHNLSPDVQRAVIECWDETGRPKYDHVQPIVMLLDTCDTQEQFLAKYTEMMSGFSDGQFKIQDDAELYWKIYRAGIYRLEKSINK